MDTASPASLSLQCCSPQVKGQAHLPSNIHTPHFIITFLSHVCRVQNVLLTVLNFVVLHWLLSKIHKSSSPAGFQHPLLMFAAHTHVISNMVLPLFPHSPHAVNPLPDHLPSPLLLLLPLLHRRRGYLPHTAIICPLHSSPPHPLSCGESTNSDFARDIFAL